ncbi:MAG: LL-diaminopimelate aminotransferase [Chloroflexi bacterium]|nr:LL-diaminopimelate aminotransferase [Chloroflexota bacterium]
MRFSKRLDQLQPYLFVEISRKIAEKKARGEEVISFGIGDPDIPTPPHIVERLIKASRDPVNHRYPETNGLPELRHAISHWYEARFGVRLDPEKEVLPLIGAKEGIGHVALCFLDQGDVALVPDPGYPVYHVGTMFAGGEPYYLPLHEENGWLPDLESVPEEVRQKAKVIWLNYPNNPTGAVAHLGFFERVVAFARRYDIAVLHDAPYTEVSYDGYSPVSFLQTPGAKEVGIEFHSLSKSYNMTGWRIGMAVGNAAMINALFKVKSNLDSGIPQAIQHAGIEALTAPRESVMEHNRIYQQRRDLVLEALTKLGLRATSPRAGLYIWARVPLGYSSAQFAAALLDEKGIVVTPGSSYGRQGEGFVRLSLTLPDSDVEKAVARLSGWQVPPVTNG